MCTVDSELPEEMVANADESYYANSNYEDDSQASVSLHLAEEDERRAFRDAFITEIGGDFSKRITVRELVDVIVCAGKDVTFEDLQRSWPYGTGRDQIKYEEALHIFQQIAPTNYSLLFQSFATITFNGELDFERIVTHLEESIINLENSDESADEDVSQLRDILKWFREKRMQSFDIESMMSDFRLYQNLLREINAKIVKQQNREANAMPFLPKSSSESLSSLFSNRNAAMAADDHRLLSSRNNNNNSSTANNNNNTNSVGHLSGGAISIASSFRESNCNERVTKKSLVIQKSQTRSTCVFYSFTLFRPQRVRVGIRVNDKNKIDPSLARYQNTLLGYIASTDGTNTIYGVTRRKENGVVCTDWIQLPTGTFTFHVKFCRPLKMVEPEKSDEILDSRRMLTKSFKVMLMNLFDMFDLDDDGLLNRAEFELYSILSGSGKIVDDKWKKIVQNFELRDNGLSIKTFIKMHQAEADSYGPNTYLHDMWMAVRQLGHNSKFFMSTACPLLLEFDLSEGATFSTFDMHESNTEVEAFLADYFWDNGTLLPFLKDMHSLRHYKTDYFAVLMAGKIDEDAEYKLDLTSSNSVNIEGNDLIIEKKVPANTNQILTVAIAQADSWYLNVKRKQ